MDETRSVKNSLPGVKRTYTAMTVMTQQWAALVSSFNLVTTVQSTDGVVAEWRARSTRVRRTLVRIPLKPVTA